MDLERRDIATASQTDLRLLGLGWENFNLAIQEFQISCRYGEWERAEWSRLRAMTWIESNLDIFSGIYKRLESPRG